MQAVDTKGDKAKTLGKPEEAKRQLEPLKRGATGLFEASNNTWLATAPPGAIPLELDQHPTFWNLLSDDVRPCDDIKVIAHDRSWVARFEILDAVPGHVVAKLAYSMHCGIRAVAAGKELPKDWDIVRTDPSPSEPDGWVAVNRVNGKKILESGMPFKTYEDARRGLMDHPIFREDHTARLP